MSSNENALSLTVVIWLATIVSTRVKRIIGVSTPDALHGSLARTIWCSIIERTCHPRAVDTSITTDDSITSTNTTTYPLLACTTRLMSTMITSIHSIRCATLLPRTTRPPPCPLLWCSQSRSHLNQLYVTVLRPFHPPRQRLRRLPPEDSSCLHRTVKPASRSSLTLSAHSAKQQSILAAASIHVAPYLLVCLLFYLFLLLFFYFSTFTYAGSTMMMDDGGHNDERRRRWRWWYYLLLERRCLICIYILLFSFFIFLSSGPLFFHHPSCIILLPCTLCPEFPYTLTYMSIQENLHKIRVRNKDPGGSYSLYVTLLRCRSLFLNIWPHCKASWRI